MLSSAVDWTIWSLDLEVLTSYFHLEFYLGISGLNGMITEQGNSLSVGQKQLLCLARAVLSPCKIVCIDEATANVDAETDGHLQNVIQQCLCDRQRWVYIYQIMLLYKLHKKVLSCDWPIKGLDDVLLIPGIRTVVTIAHRVESVLACDRVMLMEDGNIVETGAPNQLLQDRSSRFSRLVENR